MKGDFSRNTFDAANHFSRVLMQQGRVQLDADWNEQASILLHYLQTLAADLIGPYGGPALADGTPGNGFKIEVARDSNGNPIPKDFGIGVGHYYVDGMLCENEQDGCAYTNQPDYTLVDDSKLGSGKTYLVYLDVWEQHITSIEEGRIREVALGGPDTATRAKVVWQVRATDTRPYVDTASDWLNADCEAMQTQWPKWLEAWRAQADGRLAARLDPGQITPDPCTIAPTSAYRGQENQLYRVEIHTSGNVTGGKVPTFKWSRDNGSIVAAWLGMSEDGALLVSNTHGFRAGQWVEITDKDDDLLAQPGDFFKVTRVEAGALYIEPSSTPVPAWHQDQLQKVRCWDQTENANIKLSDGAVPIAQDASAAVADWINLEDGLQVQFQLDHNYHTGDYWLIPARTTGAIDWPGDVDAQSNPVPQPSHGIVHHYAPLWIITTDAGGSVTIGTDLRCAFPPGAGCPTGNA